MSCKDGIKESEHSKEQKIAKSGLSMFKKAVVSINGMRTARKGSQCVKKGKNLGIYTVDDIYKKKKGSEKYKNIYASDCMKQA